MNREEKCPHHLKVRASRKAMADIREAAAITKKLGGRGRRRRKKRVEQNQEMCRNRVRQRSKGGVRRGRDENRWDPGRRQRRTGGGMSRGWEAGARDGGGKRRKGRRRGSPF